MGVDWRKADRPQKRSGYERSRPATQVYINSGWSEMTPTHKNVNEDIREKHECAHTQNPAEVWAVRTGLDNVPLKGGRQ